MKNEKYDVFISYSSKDQKIAEAMSHYLEERNLRCFVAYRDAPKGEDWGPFIEDAIEDATVFVYVHSKSSNKSKETTREINLAFDENCVLIPFRLSSDKYQEGKRYRLNNLSWLDAFPGDPKNYFGELFNTIRTHFPDRIQEIGEEDTNKVHNMAEEERHKSKLWYILITLIVCCSTFVYVKYNNNNKQLKITDSQTKKEKITDNHENVFNFVGHTESV